MLSLFSLLNHTRYCFVYISGNCISCTQHLLFLMSPSPPGAVRCTTGATPRPPACSSSTTSPTSSLTSGNVTAGLPTVVNIAPGEGEGSHGVALFQLETGQEETAVVTNCASATESLSPVCPALNVLTARRCVNLPGDISRIFSWVSELEW